MQDGCSRHVHASSNWRLAVVSLLEIGGWVQAGDWQKIVGIQGPNLSSGRDQELLAGSTTEMKATFVYFPWAPYLNLRFPKQGKTGCLSKHKRYSWVISPYLVKRPEVKTGIIGPSLAT